MQLVERSGVRRHLTWLALASVVAGCSTEPEGANTRDNPVKVPPQFVVEDPAGIYDIREISPCTNITVPTADDGCARINGALVTFGDAAQVGTGNIDPFLQIQDSPDEEAYNTSSDTPLPDMGASANFNHDLALSRVPVLKLSDGILYREIVLDANESNAGDPENGDQNFSIDVMQVWLIAGPADDAPNDDQMASPPASLADLQARGEKVWEMVEGGEAKVILATDAFSSGSGNRSDYQFFIPEALFEAAIGQVQVQSCPYAGPDAPPCGFWLVVYSELGKTGDGFITNATFEEYATVERGFVSVNKTATANFTRQYKWKITKTANPTTVNIFDGDQQEVGYEVKVEPDGFDDVDWVISGTVTIANPSQEDVSIEEPTDELTGGIAVTLTCTDEEDAVISTWPHVMGPGDVIECTYSHDFGDTPPGEGFSNTASVEITDGAVVQKTVAVVIATEPTTEIDESYTLEDSVQGDLGPGGLPSGTTDNYTRTFTCDDDEGENDNTATFTTDDTQTQGSDDATVTVNCYDLTVLKDATPTFTRAFTWSILKIADANFEPDSDLLLAIGETYEFHYKVTVDVTDQTDSDFEVNGNIKITNNHPSLAAEINDVTDVITGPINGTVTCGVTFPYSLAAGADLDCTYSADLPNATDRTNTATAEQQNHKYNAAGAEIADLGTTNYSDDADVDFNGPTTLVDECIDVEDDKFGDLGQVCYDDTLPKDFLYTLTIGPYEACGSFTFVNTASFETTDDANDTDQSGSDDHTVTITVPCEGCTLTQGYWKTHNETFKALKNGKGPPADDTWLDITPFAELSGFFTVANSYPVAGPNTPSPTAAGTPADAFTWFKVFWTPSQGNVYYNLAHQYEAAKLNVLNGVTPSGAIATAIAQAEDIFDSNTPAQIGALKGAARNTIVQLAGLLGSFNEGAAGTAHCDEDFLSRTAGAK